MKIRRPRPVAVDLFAGAGGLSLGAEMAGARVAYASDIWPDAARTHERNHPHTKFHCGPIEDIAPEDILSAAGLKQGELDILLGGPPCQGYSIYAPVRNPHDKRNALILEYLRIVAGVMPKYLVIENVPGLLSLGGGQALKAVYAELRRLDYSVEHRVLLAARYGVPQERWRLIILGRRNDMPPVRFPTPTHFSNARANFTGGAKWSDLGMFDVADVSKLAPAVTVSEAIGDLSSLKNGEGEDVAPMPPADQASLTPFQAYARAHADRIYNHTAPKLGQINMQRLGHIKVGGNWTDIPFELLPAGMKRARKSDHTKRYGRLNPSGQSCTILTKCDPHWGSFFHYEQDRAITPREAARLQSFPDTYVFLGSQVSQYEQIGNAVPPLFAKAIVGEICKALSACAEEDRDRDLAVAR